MSQKDKKNLLNLFEKSRDLVINTLFDYVNSKKNKEVMLSHFNEECLIVVDNTLYTQIYEYLYIEDNKLLIHYTVGEGYEPCEIEEIDCEVNELSMNEIYDIINHIK